MELLFFLVVSPQIIIKEIFQVESRGLEKNKYRENTFSFSLWQNEMLVCVFEVVCKGVCLMV